jgi:anti-anti-sigma factor
VFRESSREDSGACRQVLVDLRGLRFIDATGLHWLLSLRRELDGGARLELIRGCDSVKATFRHAKLTSLFTFVDADRLAM